jgi:hypothetical protein
VNISNTKTGYNGILAVLSSGDTALLEPHLRAVKFPLRQTLERANTRIEHVYFPTCGLISVVAQRPRLSAHAPSRATQISRR